MKNWMKKSTAALIIFVTAGVAHFLAAPPTFAEQVALTRIAEGRYIPGFFSDDFNSIGQGQAGYVSFDLAPIAGSRVCELRLAFTQVGTTNPQYYPLAIGIYDVSTGLDRLAVTRIPLDPEGELIALDLHTGGVYATFVVTTVGEEARSDVPLNDLAVADVNDAIEAGTRYLSLGLANVDFYAGGYFTALDATLTVTVGCLNEVQIDIKPGSVPNSVNPRSQGVLPVAVLTTAAFDASTVDVDSVTFGPTRAEEAHGRGHFEDVDADGDVDLILHFRTQETGIECGASDARLDGMTFDGRAITGVDAVQTVGCQVEPIRPPASRLRVRVSP